MRASFFRYGFGLSGKKFAGELRGSGVWAVWDVFVVEVGWSERESCSSAGAFVSVVACSLGNSPT
jgi:hypothetical protein